MKCQTCGEYLERIPAAGIEITNTPPDNLVIEGNYISEWRHRGSDVVVDPHPPVPVTTLRELAWQDLLRELDEEAGGLMDQELRKAIEHNQAAGVILFRNEAFDSSRFGEMSCLTYGGPESTFKDPGEAEGRHLNDLPSQRQYAVAYALRPAS